MSADALPTPEPPRFQLLSLAGAMRMSGRVADRLPTDEAGMFDGGLSTSPREVVALVVEAMADEGYVIAEQVTP